MESAAAGRVSNVGAGDRAGTLVRARRLRRPDWKGVALWLSVIAIMLFCLFPFYWLINVSLKTGAELSNADLLPPSPTLENYDSIFHMSSLRARTARRPSPCLHTTSSPPTA